MPQFEKFSLLYDFLKENDFDEAEICNVKYKIIIQKIYHIEITDGLIFSSRDNRPQRILVRGDKDRILDIMNHRDMFIKSVTVADIADIQPIVYSNVIPKSVPKSIVPDVDCIQMTPKIKKIINSNMPFLQKTKAINAIVKNMDITNQLLS